MTDFPWEVHDFTLAVIGIRLDCIIVCLEGFKLVFIEIFGFAFRWNYVHSLKDRSSERHH